MNLNTEIRKLSPGDLYKLVQILENDESWKRLMAVIPKTLNLDNFECKFTISNLPKYNTDHFKLIDNAGFKQRRTCSEILLEEWGTSGRIRPRLGHLIRLLEKTELYRAADYIAVDLLKIPAPERPLTGPAAKVRFSSEEIHNRLPLANQSINYPSSLLNENGLSSSIINNNLIIPNRHVVPMIIVNGTTASNSDNNNIEMNASETSKLLHEDQLQQKIEQLKHSPPIQENMTESTSLEYSSDNQMPAFSALLLNESVSKVLPEAINHEIAESFINTSNFTPDFSKIINSVNKNTNDCDLPAFSQILSNELNDSPVTSLENEIPHLSELMSNANNEPVGIPHLSDLLMISPANSVQPLSQQSSRTTCASPLPNLLLNTVLPHFTYLELEHCTEGFDETMLSTVESNNHNGGLAKGRKLGSGAFGSVYLATGLLEKAVAVKKLNLDGVNVVNVDDTITKQFRNEVELLCKYKHDNLLSLLGYSCDGPTYCLIYEYICGGALKDRLQANMKTSDQYRLLWTDRLYIALGTAKAVSYLHNAYSMPLIHRDIKSANILLDNANKPKLCDFGLIKLTPNQNTNTSTTVFGTSAYMAPEAFRGDVSVKLDTFSFGVVLLELLTSLPPLDENREGNDLVTHIEEVCENDIKPLLDTNAGTWQLGDTHFGEDLFVISMQCLEEKKRRPIMAFVVAELTELINKASILT